MKNNLVELRAQFSYYDSLFGIHLTFIIGLSFVNLDQLFRSLSMQVMCIDRSIRCLQTKAFFGPPMHFINIFFLL